MTVPLESVTRSFVSTLVPFGTHTSHCCSIPTMPLCPCSFISPSFGSLTRHLTPVAMVVKPSLVVPHALVVGVMREMVSVMSIAESMVPWHLPISIGESTVHVPSNQLCRAYPHLGGELVRQHLQAFPLLRHGEGRAAHGAEVKADGFQADPSQHDCSRRAVYVVGFAHEVDRRRLVGERPVPHEIVTRQRREQGHAAGGERGVRLPVPPAGRVKVVRPGIARGTARQRVAPGKRTGVAQDVIRAGLAVEHFLIEIITETRVRAGM